MTAILASDAERDRTLAILREHHAVGRLDVPEYESRCAEALRARYVQDLWRAVRELPVPIPASPPPMVHVPRRADSGAASVTLAVSGLLVFCMSMSLLWIFSLPLGAAAWALGRSGRRRNRAFGDPAGGAVAGEILGALVTVASLLAVAACATIAW